MFIGFNLHKSNRFFFYLGVSFATSTWLCSVVDYTFAEQARSIQGKDTNPLYGLCHEGHSV